MRCSVADAYAIAFTALLIADCTLSSLSAGCTGVHNEPTEHQSAKLDVASRIRGWDLLVRWSTERISGSPNGAAALVWLGTLRLLLSAIDESSSWTALSR